MRLALLFFLSVTAMGAHVPENCEDLCGTIETCSRKVDHADLSDLLCHMARCETGDKCVRKIRSPNGHYRGAFQFTRQTWRTICLPFFKENKIAGCAGKDGMSEPCCATMCVAEMVAEDLNGGLRNWPACGRRAKREVAAEAKEAKN